MALRALMLKKRLDDKRKELEALRAVDFSQREAELEKSIEETTTDEERSFVDSGLRNSKQRGLRMMRLSANWKQRLKIWKKNSPRLRKRTTRNRKRNSRNRKRKRQKGALLCRR